MLIGESHGGVAYHVGWEVSGPHRGLEVDERASGKPTTELDPHRREYRRATYASTSEVLHGAVMVVTYRTSGRGRNAPSRSVVHTDDVVVVQVMTR